MTDDLKWQPGEGESLEWKRTVDPGAWLLAARSLPYRMVVHPVGSGWGFSIDDGIQEIESDQTPRALADAKRAALARAAELAEEGARLLRGLIQGGEMPNIEPIYEAVGARIRAARVQARITQKQLGERVRLARLSVVAIEKARTRVQVHTLFAIADALGVRLDELLPTVIATKGEGR